MEVSVQIRLTEDQLKSLGGKIGAELRAAAEQGRAKLEARPEDLSKAGVAINRFPGVEFLTTRFGEVTVSEVRPTGAVTVFESGSNLKLAEPGIEAA